MKSGYKLSISVVCFALLAGCSQSVEVGEPPSHPFLMADSVYPMIHFDAAQTDYTALPMWTGNETIDPSRIAFAPTGIGNIGLSHRTYPNGDEVVFLSGPSHVAKYRLPPEGGLEYIDEITIPGFEHHYISPEATGALVADLDALADDEPAFIERAQATLREKDITLQSYASGVYTLMDKDGHYYAGYGTKLIRVSDVTPDDPASEIHISGSRDLRDDMPENLKDTISRFIGMNITWDGHIVVALSGAVAVVDRDMSFAKIAPITGEFVDNSITVDDENGIYLVTDQYMRKLVWTGERLSFEEKDGAWKEGYDWVKKPTSLSRGAGTTPTVMGFGDDDRLVIIADQGDPVKAVAFWRDDIPDDARQVEGAPSMRTAGHYELTIPVKSTVEWSPHVSGYGVMMFGSDFLDPVRWEHGFDLVTTCVTSGLTRPAPTGAEKFHWDSEDNRFVGDWSYADKGFTWSLAPVSGASNSVHLATIEDGVYSLTGFDWDTGAPLGEITLGKSVKFNTCGAFHVPMPDGSLYLTSVFGAVRIMPE